MALVSSGCERLLVANRGEIARRIFSTARSMGMATVAVFADGDRHHQFVADADQAVALGGRTAAETYLDITKILDAAVKTGADAVHPGYGFLAENAAFARAVIEAGLTWVGPSPDSIEVMGDKIRAKQAMAQAGVPILPSVEVPPDRHSGALAAIGDGVGFPLLVKAAAGGGGKGMRLVERPQDLAEAVAAAQREAQGAFGNDTVYLERYLPRAHHVEIQILGDVHGNLIHLYERECSIQRRHQKIIEEAPSPNVSAGLRNKMAEAALAGARAIGYYSLGTVELLMADDNHDDFFFLEMNTRLQVEHPVTEEVTGIDLVRQQLLVAGGEPLGISQSDVTLNGHAIEARLYAEDAAAGFLPVTGTVTTFEVPANEGIRVDSGITAGSPVGIEFDPMLAKLIGHGANRAEATNRLTLALEQSTVAGLTTNREFLLSTLSHPEFALGHTTTAFIDDNELAARLEPPPVTLARMVAVLVLTRLHYNRAAAPVLGFMTAGFRNSAMPAQRVLLEIESETLTVSYRTNRDGSLDASFNWSPTSHRSPLPPVTARLISLDGPKVVAEIGGISEPWNVLPPTPSPTSENRWEVHGQRFHLVALEQSPFPDGATRPVAGGQLAPMPGTVRAINVRVGDQVDQGQVLVVMEAMKMEHQVIAPSPGTVSEIRCADGDQVDNGAVLVVLDPN